MKTLVRHSALFTLIGLILSPLAMAHASSSQEQASETADHNVMLRVVRVTPDWMPFTSIGGWTQAVPLKESEILRYYEVAIWDETSSVHLYELPNDYDWAWGRGSQVPAPEEERIAYREQFLISKYTDMPQPYTDERSAFLKSAFMRNRATPGARKRVNTCFKPSRSSISAAVTPPVSSPRCRPTDDAYAP